MQKPPDLDSDGKPLVSKQVKPPDLDDNHNPEENADAIIADAKKSIVPAEKVEQKPENVPNKSFIQSLANIVGEGFNKATEPLTTLPSKFAENVGNYIDQRSLNENPHLAYGKGLVAGSLKGVGDIASSLSSPLNLVLAALTGGGSLAEKSGLEGIASALNTGTRAASVPFVAHGAKETFSRDSTIPQRLQGIAEMAGGGAGIMHAPNVAKIADEVIKPTAKFAYHQPDYEGGSFPMFNVEGGPLHQSSVSEATLREHNIPFEQAPKPPIYDRNGKPLAPPQEEVLNNRPEGPWDKNIPQEIPSGSQTEDDIFRNVTKKLRMGLPIPEEGVTPIPRPEGFVERNIVNETAKPHVRLENGEHILKNPSDAVIKGLEEKGYEVGKDGIVSKKLEAVGDIKNPEFKGNGKRRLPSRMEVQAAKALEESKKVPVNEDTGELLEKPNYTFEQAKNRQVNDKITGSMSSLTDEDLKYLDSLEEPMGWPPRPSKPKYKLEITDNSVLNTETGKPPDIPPELPNEQIPEEPNKQLDFKGNKEEEKLSIPREAYEMSRQLMSVDLPFTTSAAFRQAAPLVGTRNWFKAWEPSVKSYGSKVAYDKVMERLGNDPLVKPQVIGESASGTPVYGPSFIKDTMGVKLTDLGKINNREEFTRSHLAEKIPLYGKHIAGSNRAYTAFLNDLRVNQAKTLIEDAKVSGLDPENNHVLAKQIGDFINDATGRGSLSTSVGKYNPSLEKSAKFLGDVFFSPRLIASRIRMLNPSTYIMANPYVRKQYLYGMMRSIGTWGTMAGLAKMAGADVSMDPNNSDFGKIKIGNTRIDAGAGFQQYLVLGNRMFSGKTTSSTTGKEHEFGKGYKPTTRASTLIDFGTNKLHPELKFAYDLLAANPSRPFNMADRTVQLAAPMIASDIVELAKQDPSIATMIGIPLAGTVGMSTQTYGKGIGEPTFVPKKWDYQIR